MKRVIPKIGRAYGFLYPRYNYVGLPERLEPRRILVMSVRDLHREPLDESTAKLNPLLKRGRYLVTGQDLDKGEERNFYLESMSEIREVDQHEQKYGSAEYVSFDGDRITVASRTLGEGLAYHHEQQRGVLCKVLSRWPQSTMPRNEENPIK